MKKRQIFGKYGFLLFLMMCYFVGCYYNPTEEYYVEVEPILTPPDIELSLSPDKEVYYVTDRHTEFSFDLSHLASQGYEVYQVAIFIDTTVIATIPNLKGRFEIPFDGSMKGEYTLTMGVVTNTGSGSVADLVGAEQFIYTRSWRLFVHYSGAVSSINKVYNDDGWLKIEWDKYEGADFTSYQLMRKGDVNNFELEILDVDQNFFYDSSFVGGHVSYSVKVITSNKSFAESEGFHYQSNTEQGLQAKWVSDSTFNFSWPQSEFKALKAYLLSDMQIDDAHSATRKLVIHSTEDRSQTTARIQGGVIGNNYFSLTYLPVKNYGDTIYPDYLQKEAENLFRGEPFSVTHSFVSTQNEAHYWEMDAEVKKMNFVTGEVEVSIQPPQFYRSSDMYISPDNHYVLHVYGREIHKYDPDNGGIGQMFTMSELFGNETLYTCRNVANNGLAFFEPIRDAGYLVYDFNTMQVAMEDTSLRIKNCKLTHDGQYVMAEEKTINGDLQCYKVHNGSLEKLWERSHLDKSSWYLPFFDEKIYLEFDYDNWQMFGYRIADNVKVFTTDIRHRYGWKHGGNISRHYPHILVFDGNRNRPYTYEIKDVYTQETLYTFKSRLSDYHLRLHDKYLLSEEGVKIKYMP